MPPQAPVLVPRWEHVQALSKEFDRKALARTPPHVNHTEQAERHAENKTSDGHEDQRQLPPEHVDVPHAVHRIADIAERRREVMANRVHVGPRAAVIADRIQSLALVSRA